jgi:hypothetical protein
MSEGDATWAEEFQLKGEEVVAKVKEVVQEGNVRRIIVSDADGHSLVELPLTVGVVGALLSPPLAALGAVAALLSQCTITVVRAEHDADESAAEDEAEVAAGPETQEASETTQDAAADE